ncbi:MAG: hypothetical protein CMO55_17180 [Verrucomicrobiales bacterium]|nr:hypothetical protein [Verrucomicrobiales bacterium]
MSSASSIRWFKTTFADKLEWAVKDTPFSSDLLCAIAYQETGYVWGKYIQSLSIPEILSICVGDSLDYPKRKAFPRTRADLEAKPKGKEMFKIARKALRLVAKYESGYAGAVKNPNKFCHGFGIFQYDLQFFEEDPGYFLNESWQDFDLCLANCIKELFSAMARQGWKTKTVLTRKEKIHIAIAYNRGTSNLSKGFKQGYYSGGKYYGEWIDKYLRIAEGISVVPVVNLGMEEPEPNSLAVRVYQVAAGSVSSLRERATKYSTEVRKLDPGQVVVRLDEGEADYWRVEVNLEEGIFRGYVLADYLEPIRAIPIRTEEPVAIDLEKIPGYIRAELDMPTGALSPGTKSKEVRRVQEWLTFHEFDTSIDGEFGPATERVLKRFQKAKKLGQSGSVNERTWSKLIEPMKQVLSKPAGIETIPYPEAVLAVALQHAEVRPFEVGGQNCGPWVRLYCGGNDGEDWLWCAGFATFLMKQAAFYRGQAPLIDGSVSCDTLASQAKATDRFVSRSELVTGEFPWKSFGRCAVFLQRKSHNDWNHTGLAFNFQGTGEEIVFDTIEGNTNGGGSRNGGEARRSTRSMSGKTYDFISLA